MRNLILCIILIVGIISLFPGSVSAQDTDVNKDLELYVSWYASKTSVLDYEEDNVGGGISYGGFSLGASYDFNIGINPLVQISYYGIEEPFYEVNSNSKIWNFMVGVHLQDPDSPFYINVLSGLNRHIYTDFTFQGQKIPLISDNDDQSYISLNSFVTEVEIGAEIRLIDSLLLRVGTGFRNVHNRGKVLDNIFVKVGMVYKH